MENAILWIKTFVKIHCVHQIVNFITERFLMLIGVEVEVEVKVEDRGRGRG